MPLLKRLSRNLWLFFLKTNTLNLQLSQKTPKFQWFHTINCYFSQEIHCGYY